MKKRFLALPVCFAVCLVFLLSNSSQAYEAYGNRYGDYQVEVEDVLRLEEFEELAEYRKVMYSYISLTNNEILHFESREDLVDSTTVTEAHFYLRELVQQGSIYRFQEYSVEYSVFLEDGSYLFFPTLREAIDFLGLGHEYPFHSQGEGYEHIEPFFICCNVGFGVGVFGVCQITVGTGRYIYEHQLINGVWRAVRVGREHICAGCVTLTTSTCLGCGRRFETESRNSGCGRLFIKSL